MKNKIKVNIILSSILAGVILAGCNGGSNTQQTTTATSGANQEVKSIPNNLIPQAITWGQSLMGLIVPDPFKTLINTGISMTQFFGILPTSSSSSPDAPALARIESQLVVVTNLSQTTINDLDYFARQSNTQAFFDNVTKNLDSISNINAAFKEYYNINLVPKGNSGSDGTQVFPMSEDNYWAFAVKAAATPESYASVIRMLGGVVNGISGGDSSRYPNSLNTALMNNLQNTSAWGNLGLAFSNLITSPDSFATYDLAANIINANATLATVQAQVVSAALQSYELLALQLALYYASNGSLFRGGNLPTLFNLPDAAKGQDSYNQAIQALQTYYQYNVNNAIVNVFGGTLVTIDTNNKLTPDTTPVASPFIRSQTTAHIPYTGQDIVDTVNKVVKDSNNSSLFNSSFGTNCMPTSVSMPKQNQNAYKLGTISAVCSNSGTINLTIPYQVDSNGTAYAALGLSQLNFSNGSISVGNINRNDGFFDKAFYNQGTNNGYNGYHWGMTTEGFYTNPGSSGFLGIGYQAPYYQVGFDWNQNGTISLNDGLSIANRAINGQYVPAAENHSAGHLDQSGNYQAYTQDASWVKNGNNVVFPPNRAWWQSDQGIEYNSQCTGGTPQNSCYWNAAYFYGQLWQAYTVTTPNGHVFTVNYNDQGGFGIYDYDAAQSYYNSIVNSGGVTLKSANGYWLNSIALYCLNGDSNCSSIDNGRILTFAGANGSMDMVMLSQNGTNGNLSVKYSTNNNFTKLGNYTYSIAKNSGNSTIMLTKCDLNYSNCDGGTEISNSFSVSPASLKVMGTSGYRNDLIVQYKDWNSGSIYAKALWGGSPTNVVPMAILNAEGYTYYAVKDSGNAYIYIYKCSGNACSSALVVNGRTNNNASIKLALSGSDVVMTFDVYGGSSPVTFVGGDINNQE